MVEPTRGATLTSADGAATVTIPPGAVSEPVRVTIRELRPDEVPGSITVRSPVGRIWQLGPEGLRFELLVEVALSFDTDDLPPGVNETNLTMITIGLDGGTEELEGVVVEGPGNAGALQPAIVRRVRGRTSHFSPFAIVVLDVRKLVREERLPIGEPAVFDVEVRNRGTTPLTHVVLTDSLDSLWGISGTRVRPEDIDLNTSAFPNATVTIRPDSLSFTVDLGVVEPSETSFVRAFTLTLTGRFPAQHCNLVIVRSEGEEIGEDKGCVAYGIQ